MALMETRGPLFNYLDNKMALNYIQDEGHHHHLQVNFCCIKVHCLHFNVHLNLFHPSSLLCRPHHNCPLWELMVQEMKNFLSFSMKLVRKTVGQGFKCLFLKVLDRASIRKHKRPWGESFSIRKTSLLGRNIFQSITY